MVRKADTPYHTRPSPGTEYPSGSVRCMVCSRYFATLAGHLKTHGMDSREYRRRYPGAATMCAEIHEGSRRGARLTNEIPPHMRSKRVTYAVTKRGALPANTR